jgi:type IV pilus assembly protein PilA
MYKAMIKKSKNKKGFTLVELIVVMAILAILAAILIPSVGGMIERSNKAVDVATARNLYMAGQLMLAQGVGGTVTITDGNATLTGTAANLKEFTDFIGTTAPDLKYANSMVLNVVTGSSVNVSANVGSGSGSTVTYSSTNGTFGTGW